MRECRHYFLPEVNLFENVPHEFLVMERQYQTLVNIRRDPCKHLSLTNQQGYYFPGANEVSLCSKAIYTQLKLLESELKTNNKLLNKTNQRCLKAFLSEPEHSKIYS